MSASSDVPFATLTATGTVEKLTSLQSIHFLSAGTWSLRFHSVVLYDVPLIRDVLLLTANLVQPNQALQRELILSGTLGWKWDNCQPLHYISVSVDKEPVPVKLIPINETVYFSINRPSSTLELNLQSVLPAGARRLEPNTKALLHFSLYKRSDSCW